MRGVGVGVGVLLRRGGEGGLERARAGLEDCWEADGGRLKVGYWERK